MPTPEDIKALLESFKSKEPSPLSNIPDTSEELKTIKERAGIKDLIKSSETLGRSELTRPRPTSAMFLEILRLHGSEVNRILNRYGVPPGDMDKCLTELSQLFD